MGCSSTHIIESFLEHTNPIQLTNIDNIDKLKHAQNLISLIIKIKNRIVYIYHKLIYSTGAFIYFQPLISHCLENILYKISTEYNGYFNKSGIIFYEESPFLKVDFTKISIDSCKLINELFNFITELKGYKTILKNIDNDLPSLLYLEYEINLKISKRNLRKIHNGLSLFRQLLSFRQKIWAEYKKEILLLINENEKYLNEINEIGNLASQKQLNNIEEIAILKNEIKNNFNSDIKMFTNIKEAKENWERILNKDVDNNLENSFIN